MTLYKINYESKGSPKKVFNTICDSSEKVPVLYQILSTIGWSNIALEIGQLSDELIFPASGQVLSGFAISYINHIQTIKLPHITLDQGTECIKQLIEIKINSFTDINDSEKAVTIEWYREFLDIWKNNMAETLKRENLLID